MAAELVLGGLLGLLSIEDIKKQEISFSLLGVAAAAGIIVLIFQTFAGWTDFFLRMLPGAALLMFAVLTRGKIGTGDGLVFLVIGLFCSVSQVVGMLVGAFLASSAVAVVLLVVRKRKKTDTFPFIPCIFVAYVIGLILQMSKLVG